MGRRLDAHVHWYGEGTMLALRPIVERLGITHFVAIAEDPFLDTLDRVNETGAIGIPFHRLDLMKEDPFSDVPVAGYKIHLRHTPPWPDGPINMIATPRHVGHVCRRAGLEGRPILFHTDADDPNPCSVPMLAQLARDFPDTTLIAAHAGMYGFETFQVSYTADVFEPMVKDLWRIYLRQFLTTPNLYGDLTKLGMNFPSRSSSPTHLAEAFVEVVHEFPRAERRALCSKLFCGTDFPGWTVAENAPEYDAFGVKLPRAVVEASDLALQIRYMEEAFDDLFDEDAMADHFLDLLPMSFE